MKHFAAECEVGKRISCTALRNIYFCELQCLNWPNYGKSSQVIFVKPEIIDESLVSAPLITEDSGIKH